MGASFRSTAQVEALAGCDRLTVSPALLQQLAESEGAVERKLVPEWHTPVEPVEMDQVRFRWEMNEGTRWRPNCLPPASGGSRKTWSSFAPL
jgi:transaldolase